MSEQAGRERERLLGGANFPTGGWGKWYGTFRSTSLPVPTVHYLRSLHSLTTFTYFPSQHDQADTKDLSSSSKFSASCVLT